MFHFLRKKYILKIISFLSSILIWMYVVSSAELVNTKMIPLHINLPANLSLGNIVENKMEFRIKGPGLFVRKFIEKEIAIKIESKDYYKRGKKSYSINLEKLIPKLPLGVELISFEPAQLRLELVKESSKVVDVIADLPVSFKESQIGDFKITPSKVTLFGPKDVLKEIDHIDTKLIEGVSPKNQFQKTVELVELDPRISFKEKLFTVEYKEDAKSVEFTYSKIPIIFQSVNLVKRVKNKFVEVRVRGDEKTIKNLTADSIHVIASIPGNLTGRYDVELIAELPSDISLVEIKPSKISVSME